MQKPQSRNRGRSAVLKTASIIMLFACFAMPSPSEAKPPNIIFLMTDDQRWDNFGCYGRPEFQTHNIDKLAEQGVIFDKAYFAVSICMPSRVTMMTGRHISSHRAGFVPPNNFTLSNADFANSYPALLKKAGYRTGFIGKMGFAITETAQQPSDPNGYNLKEHFGNTYDFFAGDGTHYKGAFQFWPKNDPGLKEIYRKGRPRSDRTLKTGETILRFLDTQPKDRPFCLSVSFWAVKHDGDVIHPPHYERFKDVQFPVPENWVEGDNENLPKVVRENWRGVEFHRKQSGTPQAYQNLVRKFAAQGYSVDQQVGLMMEKLKELDLLDNTVIIYTSDNGRFQGSHGLYDKALLYEDSVKQPLIVLDNRVPASKRGRRETALLSSVDIAPTILSLAGIEPPASMQGRDFSAVLDQTQDMAEWRDAVLMENLFLVALHRGRNQPDIDTLNQQLIAENKSYRCRGVATQRYKYFIYYEHTPPIEELYDLEKDPNEQNNLADNPELASVLSSLRNTTEALHARTTR